MDVTLWNLFIAFARATLLGYGGGPSIIPLYEHEVVSNFKWLTTREFGEALAIGNALPGPIATKLAAYIGFKIAGWLGAFVALTAVVMPTALLMILLVGVLHKFQNHPILRGAIKGIQPVIFVMLAMLAFDFAKYAFAASGQSIVPFLPFAIAAAFFIMVHYLGLNPVWGVVGALIVGAVAMR